MFCEEEIGPHTNRPTDHSPRPEHSLSPSLPFARLTCELRSERRKTDVTGSLNRPTMLWCRVAHPSQNRGRARESAYATLLFCTVLPVCSVLSSGDRSGPNDGRPLSDLMMVRGGRLNGRLEMSSVRATEVKKKPG